MQENTDIIGSIVSYIPDYGATVVLIIFMVFYNRHITKVLDGYSEILEDMHEVLRDCMGRSTPRN